MKVSVWDTYVKREDGKMMHFDILVPSTLQEEGKILGFGERYLKGKSFQTFGLTSKECTFCHMEHASETIAAHIKKDGFYILEMENCD